MKSRFSILISMLYFFSSVSLAGQLPLEAKKRLASQQVRTCHAAWHLARSEGMKYLPLHESEMIKKLFPDLIPRGIRGCGWQFLVMHRKMIRWLNKILVEDINDPTYKSVEGWKEIPWKNFPKDFSTKVEDRRLGEKLRKVKTDGAQRQMRIVEYLKDSTNLKNLDEFKFGYKIIEIKLHDWMHLRWSDFRGYNENRNGNIDVRNDDLLNFNSSQVNDVFWGIHGWIDDRFSDWLRYHPELQEKLKNELDDVWCGNPNLKLEEGNKKAIIDDLSKSKEFITLSKDLALRLYRIEPKPKMNQSK